MNREEKGVEVNIWGFYNPRAYLLRLVNWEDEQRYRDRELYPRYLMGDCDRRTKKEWRKRLKTLVASIAFV